MKWRFAPRMATWQGQWHAGGLQHEPMGVTPHNPRNIHVLYLVMCIPRQLPMTLVATLLARRHHPHYVGNVDPFGTASLVHVLFEPIMFFCFFMPWKTWQSTIICSNKNALHVAILTNLDARLRTCFFMSSLNDVTPCPRIPSNVLGARQNGPTS